ncbi:hypothetical protein [Neobacillus kokaensis]|uniref:LRAT domain-containing protein n=1 Tax=Neobacillus kokaensis TaxID=2759023 RepID=A0ABQ3MVG7_9BACI|nr:hypothetical protein [Neobacillus kokaensis]GHH96653.1 hypothetical protein AM1BK_01960 [Neobacillus kokaensis]
MEVFDWINKQLGLFIEKHGSLPEYFEKININSSTIRSSNTSEYSIQKFEPAYGSLVYTELFGGLAEHSGIYIGNKQIISMDGKGRIKKEGLNEFTGNISTINYEIYVPCYDGVNTAIGYHKAAWNAEEKLSESRNYHLLFDNCHQFSAVCITGNFENNSNFLMFLKDDFQRAVGVEKIVWRKWNWKN